MTSSTLQGTSLSRKENILALHKDFFISLRPYKWLLQNYKIIGAGTITDSRVHPMNK
jgi:hypothetical protein